MRNSAVTSNSMSIPKPLRRSARQETEQAVRDEMKRRKYENPSIQFRIGLLYGALFAGVLLISLFHFLILPILPI